MPVCQTRWSCRKVYICIEIVEVLYHNKQPREKEKFLRMLSRPGECYLDPGHFHIPLEMGALDRLCFLFVMQLACFEV